MKARAHVQAKSEAEEIFQQQRQVTIIVIFVLFLLCI